jgi:tRNA pseudouridine38-40 synthase
MQAGARHMVGTHDFSSMTPVQTQRETMVRTVLRCDIERRFDEVRIDVEGTGFLWRQVRNMVGTLLNVGRGHWPAEHVAQIIASKDRTKAGPTAPARGLCLQWVKYAPEMLRPSIPAAALAGDATL